MNNFMIMTMNTSTTDTAATAAKSADELASCVDVTLASWRAAFELSSSSSSSPTTMMSTVSPKADGGGIDSKQLASNCRSAVVASFIPCDGILVNGGGGEGSPRQRLSCSTHVTEINDDASTPRKIILWKDSLDEYRRRLATFRSETYFAKPLALSPLVCAAFGWENTGNDIIKCRHPNCFGGSGGGRGEVGAAICITFHPNLNEEPHNQLCQKYMDMLATCHGSKCPFRTYAGRWLKVMKHYAIDEEVDGFNDGPSYGDTKLADKDSNESNDTNHIVFSTTTKLYVPPYFLSISDEFLLFEDCSADGSITRDRVREDAIKIRDMSQDRMVHVDVSQMELTVPDVVTDYCRAINPNVEFDDVINTGGETMKTHYLLATFGWSICTDVVDDNSDNNSRAIVKCNMCLSRSRLELPSSRADDVEIGSRKRRRMDARFHLIDSHRMYCPFKSGFAYRPGATSQLPGWKVVVSNMMKKTSLCHLSQNRHK